MPRRASRSAAGPERAPRRLPARSCPSTHARRPAEPGQRQQQAGSDSPGAGAVSGTTSVAAVPQQLPHPGPLGPPRPGDRLPGAGTSSVVRRCGSARHARRRGRARAAAEHAQRAVGDLGERLGGQHGVDAARARRGSRRSARRRGTSRRTAPRRPGARGSRSARPARRPSRARATPTRRTPRRWSGGAGRRGRAGRPPCAPAIAAVILTIWTNATVPSCIRVPPDAGAASSGSRSAVARSTAASPARPRPARSTRRGSRTRRRRPPPGGRGCGPRR